MMCQFHSGTIMDHRPNPWRGVVGPPRPSCYHGNNPIACCRSSPPSGGVVGCHASHQSSCHHGNSAIVCCHETEMLRQLAGSWSLWKPVPVPAAANTFVGTAAAGYYRNGGCRSNTTSARKSVTSFSISAILGGGGSGGGHSSSEDDNRKRKTTVEDQTSTTTTTKSSIIRPWDDEVSNDPSSCSREWHRSDEDGDEEEDMDMHEVVDRGVVVDDDDDGREEVDEEEIDVGGGCGGGSGKAMAEVSLGSAGSSSDCPLDALLRMTSQTHFIHQRRINNNNNAQATTTTMMTTTTIDYNSDDSGASPHHFPSPSKATNSSSLFHRSSSSHPVKKRRKTRTAFTNNQIFQLEQRFLYQKYLTPTDRDELAMSLRLTNSQVITWFQNRRAKLKRDLEELKADVSAAKALGNEPSTSVLSRLDELIKANDSGLKKKDRNAGDTSRPPIAKSPPNKTTSFKAADEETAVSSSTTTVVKDINSLC